MSRRVALVRTDVTEESSTSFTRVTRIGELGTTLAVTSNRRTSGLAYLQTDAERVARSMLRAPEASGTRAEVYSLIICINSRTVIPFHYAASVTCQVQRDTETARVSRTCPLLSAAMATSGILRQM
jgi:hypothetical protein